MSMTELKKQIVDRCTTEELIVLMQAAQIEAKYLEQIKQENNND